MHVRMSNVVETMGKKVRREKGTNVIMREEIGWLIREMIAYVSATTSYLVEKDSYIYTRSSFVFFWCIILLRCSYTIIHSDHYAMNMNLKIRLDLQRGLFHHRICILMTNNTSESRWSQRLVRTTAPPLKRPCALQEGMLYQLHCLVTLQLYFIFLPIIVFRSVVVWKCRLSRRKVLPCCHICSCASNLSSFMFIVYFDAMFAMSNQQHHSQSRIAYAHGKRIDYAIGIGRYSTVSWEDGRRMKRAGPLLTRTTHHNYPLRDSSSSSISSFSSISDVQEFFDCCVLVLVA